MEQKTCVHVSVRIRTHNMCLTVIAKNKLVCTYISWFTFFLIGQAFVARNYHLSSAAIMCNKDR